ncbi:BKACE family enzyme [Roseomonas elaeocarpi]|uniref:3-keto-5-aminohexanoate cleavage protein n=1 Tax=Roseomonas elaeocarpi TaxID=907779 RepID=A0ABV6JSW5_9PROT
MARKIILTCAVTGGDDVADRFKAIPVTPAQIAQAAIDSCKAGAAIAHIHVRDPETGKPSMGLHLYREVVERIRDSGSPVIVNLTTGPGARYIPADEGVNQPAPGSNLRGPAERVRHITELRPELCSLDMGSLNFGKGALINIPAHVQAIGAAIREAGVKPELEVFDTGHVALALRMIEKGLLDPQPLFQAVLGVPWGAPATTETMALFKALIPHGSAWASFGIGRHEFPMVAQAVLLGAHARVGLEDNLYLERGVPAENNTVLVERAVHIIRTLGEEVATPDEARAILGLPPR